MIDDALLRVMSARAGTQQAFSRPPTPLTGGFWAAIYSFELAAPPHELSGPLVLRVMPTTGPVSETIVQREVAEQGYPTPRVVADGVDESLGGAFMVMEHVDGVQLLAGLGMGKLLLQLPATLRRLAHQMSTAALRLHALDPMPVVDALIAAGINVGALGVDARLAEVREAARTTSAGFDGVLTWLDNHRPAMTPAVVCHGDIHPFNMLVTPDGSFNVLDWTNGNLCRREYDVGFTAALLQCAPMEAPRIARRPVEGIAGALSHRFVDSYRRMAPINLDVVEWFETLQYARCLAAVATSPLDHSIIGPKHPFRISAPAMIRQLTMITDTKIELPAQS
jgi:aminoglycoside phosphotransferase (APT) family kinase protein